MEKVWAQVMMEARSLPDEKLFQLALGINPYDSVQTNRVFWIGELARRGGQPIIDRALQLSRSFDVSKQCLGIDLLGDLGLFDRMSATDECVEVLVAACKSTNTLIVERTVHALGALAPKVTLPILLEMSTHPDDWVRREVAGALGLFVEEPVGDSNGVVKVLLQLMTDGCDLVRDSATFSLGVLLNADGSLIRDSLADRLIDSYEDTRLTALASLARRRDSRALRPVFEALQQGKGDRLLLEAAAFLADPSLFPLLCNLLDDGSQELEVAKSRCSTKAKLELSDKLKVFLELASRRGLSIAIYSDTLSSDGPQLSQPDRMDLCWDFGALLDRSGCDVARMVDLVEADISSGLA